MAITTAPTTAVATIAWPTTAAVTTTVPAGAVATAAEPTTHRCHHSFLHLCQRRHRSKPQIQPQNLHTPRRRHAAL